jgi:hypothetical protein
MNKPSKKVSPYYSLNNIERLLKLNRETLRKIALHAGSYYNPYDIKEIKSNSNGDWRHIANPNKVLKKVQNKIYLAILKKQMLLLPNGVIGGISGKSIKDNSNPHLRQEMVVTIDIKKCYPNTTVKMVFKAWRETIDCGEKIAQLLTQLTTFQRQLPQGAPTSNALCNLCLLPVFNEIKTYSDSHDIGFTLFVDDITVSGKTKAVLDSISSIVAIIKKYGYSVSNRKIRKMPANKPQIVTGIVVNRKISLAHNKIESVRSSILLIARRNSGITRYEYNSIFGKIKHVKNFSWDKGERLEEFANMLLPKKIKVADSEQNVVIRKCRHHIS